MTLTEEFAQPMRRPDIYTESPPSPETAAPSRDDCGRVTVNQIELAYQRQGPRDAPAVLLIMGLGGQLTSWPESFCQTLLDAGFQVIRFDNRDAGLSSQLDQHGQPRLLRIAGAQALRRRARAPYLLDDMARDVIGLMDALHVPAAHIVGVSMGGMIAQILGARHAGRVLSLSLLMTTSGDQRLPGPSTKLKLWMLRPRSSRPERALLEAMRGLQMVGSPAYPRSEQELRATLEPQIERARRPLGTKRQLAAIVASGARTALLPRIQAPTLVLHGAADPLVPVAAGHDLAKRIRGSRLDVVPGLGHDLPQAAVPRIARSVLSHLQQAEWPDASAA